MKSSGRANGIYFRNLNGLRFVAALAVLVHHFEQLKWQWGLANCWTTSAPIGLLGKLGVVLFFVLSGFLITYLLLEEEQRAGIRVGRFYLRRVLRIWPLYYVTIFLALFVVPYVTALTVPGFGIAVVHQDLLLKTALYATLFANVVLANVGVVPYAAQAWSVGTEEQFYLIWPILMKRARNKVALMLAVIAGYLAVKALLLPAVVGHGTWQTWLGGFWGAFNIDCMAIGGLAAVILHKKLWLHTLLVNLPVFYTTLAATLALIALGVEIPHVHFEFYAVLFAILILNFAANPRIGWSMEFEPFHYLGTISYGLYMLHPLTFSIVIRLLSRLGWTHDAVLFPACLLATIGVAGLSYRFLETPFLRLKGRFAEVVSGESARNSASL